MILKQVFKTPTGANKRARFENTHCNERYHYNVIRFFEGRLGVSMQTPSLLQLHLRMSEFHPN